MTRSITLCWLAILAAACSDGASEPWNAAEMSALSEQFRHIAEAYAVVDVCMPMIDANIFAHHRQRGGTDKQAAALDRIYRESHEAAAQLLTSVDGCVETASDYANTILNTKVRPVP